MLSDKVYIFFILRLQKSDLNVTTWLVLSAYKSTNAIQLANGLRAWWCPSPADRRVHQLMKSNPLIGKLSCNQKCGCSVVNSLDCIWICSIGQKSYLLLIRDGMPAGQGLQQLTWTEESLFRYFSYRYLLLSNT
jgi:hypothetical protein